MQNPFRYLIGMVRQIDTSYFVVRQHELGEGLIMIRADKTPFIKSAGTIFEKMVSVVIITERKEKT
jgi:hypothetical protein